MIDILTWAFTAQLDFWNHALKEGHTGMIRVPPRSVDGMLKAIKSEGMQYNINTDDLQRQSSATFLLLFLLSSYTRFLAL